MTLLIIGALVVLLAVALIEIPWTPKPDQVRMAQSLRGIRGELRTLAPQVASYRRHHTQRSARDGKLHVFLICNTDEEIEGVTSRNQELRSLLAASMIKKGFQRRDSDDLELGVVSQQHIDQCGGPFHYWREQGYR